MLVAVRDGNEVLLFHVVGDEKLFFLLAHNLEKAKRYLLDKLDNISSINSEDRVVNAVRTI